MIDTMVTTVSEDVVRIISTIIYIYIYIYIYMTRFVYSIR